MCLEERNTLSRSRAPAAALMVRLMRALRRSACLVAMADPVRLCRLLLLAFLTEDIFARISHALALVGFRRPEAADFRRDLTDLLLVDTRHYDFGRLRRCDRDAVRDRKDNIVAVAERDLQVLALDRGAIADAGNFELALEPRGNPGDEIGDEGARGPPHGKRALAARARVHLDRPLVQLHHDFFGYDILQGAFRSLHLHGLALNARRNAGRYRNRFLADA